VPLANMATFVGAAAAMFAVAEQVALQRLAAMFAVAEQAALQCPAAMFAVAEQVALQRLAAPLPGCSRAARAVRNPYPAAKTEITSLVAQVAHRVVMRYFPGRSAESSMMVMTARRLDLWERNPVLAA
jgi:hypothetical protein